MIIINRINRKNSNSSGTNTYLYASQFSIVVNVITKITAPPSPAAVLTSRETLVNGHMPRNVVNRMFCVKIAAKQVTTATQISDPIPFDGNGKFIEAFTPDKARWLRYKTKPSANFAALGIGNFT